jgi:hypothetical protein
LRVDWDHVTEDLDEVRRIVDLLAVRDNLISLPSLNESLNDSLWGVRGIRTHVDGECELGVELLNHISKLVGNSKLIILDPLLQNRNLALLEDRSGQNQRFNLV